MSTSYQNSLNDSLAQIVLCPQVDWTIVSNMVPVKQMALDILCDIQMGQISLLLYWSGACSAVLCNVQGFTQNMLLLLHLQHF